MYSLNHIEPFFLLSQQKLRRGVLGLLRLGEGGEGNEGFVNLFVMKEVGKSL